MDKSLHTSQALAMLNSGQRVTLKVVTTKGKINIYEDVISLSYDHYVGTRTIKFLRSGQIRTIHDVLIIGIDDFEVFL